jgi:hypothetical protein
MMGRKYRGMSTLGMVFVLVMIVLLVSVGLKIAPHYMNHQAIKELISDLTPEEAKAGRPALQETLRKRFKINALYDLDPAKIVQYKRERGTVTVTVDYEIREHLVANVYVLLDFNEVRTF